MKSINFFPRSGGIELDLRKELNRTLHGAPDEVAKGALAILRRMRRADGVVYPVKSTDLLPCDCRTNGYENEPDKDYPCDVCEGEGYLFDDEIVALYKTNRYEYQDVEKYKAWGKHTVSMSFFYVEYHESISRFDKLLEANHNLQGEIISPVQLLHRHNVHMAESFRADTGRVEFWRLSCWTD
tara:strand:- start:1768 stop:2316 length:549 start_codon:yes stop_codon:yes gene_type:complete